MDNQPDELQLLEGMMRQQTNRHFRLLTAVTNGTFPDYLQGELDAANGRIHATTRNEDEATDRGRGTAEGTTGTGGASSASTAPRPDVDGD